MSFFGFGSATPEIELILDGIENRKFAEIKNEEGKLAKHPLYFDGETVSGEVKITLRRGNGRCEKHQGIRIDLIGQIELFYDRGNQFNFLSQYRNLALPGDFLSHQTFKFQFNNVQKPYESYTGINCMLRYFLKVSIIKRLSDITKEQELVVHQLSKYPELNNSIKMEVGIEDCLHIEFEYNRAKYHLQDVIIGKIYFILVRIKIKTMELSIIKRETAGSGPNTFSENETIAKFEIMDGAPVKGESVPIRVFLSGYALTPTFKDVDRKFSVRYYLNLVLVDEEERRYFKQQEIILWRKVDVPKKTFQATLQQQYREMKNPNVQISTLSIASSNSGTTAIKENGSNGDIKASTDIAAPAIVVTNAETSAVITMESDCPSSSSASASNSHDDVVLSQDFATMAINGNGKKAVGNKKQKSEEDAINSRPPSPQPEKAPVTIPVQKKKKETQIGVKTAHFFKGEGRIPFNVVGTKKELSGDDSDDDIPTLTGSICEADVHNVSHELAVDAAAAVGVGGTGENGLGYQDGKEE